MKNLTLNDSTQQELLPHLQITEDLLAKVATKLSGCKKTASITAMPDLGMFVVQPYLDCLRRYQ